MARGEGFLYQAIDSAPVFGNRFGPGETAHLGEIDAAKTKAGDEDIDAVSQRFVSDGRYGAGDGFRAVGFSPPMFNLRMGV